MVLLKAKDAIVLLIGIIISILFYFFSLVKTVELESFVIVYIIIVMIIIMMAGFLWAFHMRSNELESRLVMQSREITDLNKRLKTLEDLNDIRLNIKELQGKVFKR